MLVFNRVHIALWSFQIVVMLGDPISGTSEEVPIGDRCRQGMQGSIEGSQIQAAPSEGVEVAD